MPLAGWEDGWEDRFRQKIVAAVLVSGCGSIMSARKHHLSIWQNLPVHVIGYSSITGLFSVIQETLRGVRTKHDALNSLAAGSVAGGLAAGHFQGAQYRLLGALVWGPLCSMLHVLNDAAKPRHILEDWLVSEGLLSPLVVEQRQRLRAASAADKVYQQALGEGGVPLSTQQEAERIRRREMAALMMQRAQQAQQASSTGAALREDDALRIGGRHDDGTGYNSSSTTSSISTSTSPLVGEERSSLAPKKRGWWAWLTGRWMGSRKKEEAGIASSSSPSSAAQQDSSHESGSGERGVQMKENGGAEGSENMTEDEEDEAAFQRWLSSQPVSPEGLVVPGNV
ncbi:hypothetical protein DUNSADRAFT_956 [Dunaliella salina]|uniref:Uncharacterized protein n=1 Tax=Dunaliella salina TaxID=3046 RepID=A0ABQ7GXQ4_DUNSA|nr:hypothetical protein DUNSADRAFT_956 [Dunaliella salina]|eukprot:KAF5839385.1 hypothetical protein DUNSADRAFT_956 [Dunaliella salina]